MMTLLDSDTEKTSILRYVYVSVISHSYSGATLLARLLANHPEIASTGEMNGPNPAKIDVADYRCSGGQLIRSCEFWRTVQQGMHDQGHKLDVRDFNTRFVPSGHPVGARQRVGSMGSNALESMRDAIPRIWPRYVRQLKDQVARMRLL